MTDRTRTGLLHWQFELTWALMEYHLERLVPDDFLWEPARLCWTVRASADGTWRPDWADTEPDPVPVPTIAWLSWHIGWWWGTATDHALGRAPRERTQVAWPGADNAVAWLRDLRAEWTEALERLGDADLDARCGFPGQDDPDHSVAHMVAWVNAELMKNAAEIGQLRLLRTALMS
jgi:hypothetical protein